MKTKLLLAAFAAASLQASDQNVTENLPPLTVRSQGDALPWLLSAKPELTDTGFADQLRRFSGFTQTSSTQIGSIEGAPSRFTALFWEGMNIADATGTDRQATFVNTLLLSGDRIRLAQGAVQSIHAHGGSGAILIDQRTDAPSRIALGGSNQGERFQSGRIKLQGPIDGYVAAESRFSGGYTAYAAEAGKLDTASEKDESRSISYRGVVNVPATDRLKFTLKALDAVSHSEYDAGWPTDSADAESFWDTRLQMQGYEAAFSPAESVILKAGLHRQHNRRENAGGDLYTGENLKQFAEGGLNTDFAGFRAGISQMREEGTIEAASPMEGQNRQRDLHASIRGALGSSRIDLAARQVRFSPGEGETVNDLGYHAAWNHTFEAGETVYSGGLSMARSVQPPSLVQQLNPYGAANPGLKTERLEQKRLSLGADFGVLQINAAGFQTEIKNYINWVNNELDWTASRYENVDQVSFRGGFFHVSLKPFEQLLIYADQTRLFDRESSAESLKDRQSDRITTAGAVFKRGALTLGYDLRLGSGYTDSASGEELKGERTDSLSLSYETEQKQKVQLTVKNLTDSYRESAYGYTPAVPERTVYLALEQLF